jgi:DNA-binding MarR family transcriptional regulator
MSNNIIMKISNKDNRITGINHPHEETHLLREVMRTHQALLSIFTREVGMPVSRLALLRLLAISYPNEIGIMDMARHLGINAAAVTRQVKQLEIKHLVSRLSDSKDGRRNSVKLSSEGVQLFEHIHKRGHAFEARLYKSISPDELAAAIRVLSQVRSAIEEF